MQIKTQNLIKYVLPTILSNVCFFMFTIIDGIFVGHGVGTDALGAVNIVFPYVMIAGALFMLTTVGGVTVAAIRLGRGEPEGANQAFMHALSGTVLTASVLSLVGALFTGPVARLLGAEGVYYEMVCDYLFCYSLFLIPSGLGTTLSNFCRNDGSPMLVSAAVMVSTVLNIFGDWLFVFPLRMGLRGAALATGISQSISLLVVLSHFLLRRGALHFAPFRPSAALYRKLAVRGLPETIAQLATPISTFWTNFVLLERTGPVGVNAFSIICYVASFSVAIFFGASVGLQPLFGQSYGAKNDKDLKFYFRAGIVICLAGSTLITLLLLPLGGPICAMFGADPETLEFTLLHMPEYAWGFIIMSLNTMISAYLYSTKRSRQAIIINLLRSVLVNSAVILLLPALFGAGAIWYTFGVYESIVLVAAVALLRASERNGIVYR